MLLFVSLQCVYLLLLLLQWHWLAWHNGWAFARHDPKVVVRISASPLPGNSLGQAADTCASVTKQYNLVPAYGCGCCLAGKVTTSLAESTGSLLLGGLYWVKRRLLIEGELITFRLLSYASIIFSLLIYINEMSVATFSLFKCLLLTMKAARVEVIISPAFLHWVGIALHPWPFVPDIAIYLCWKGTLNTN